MIELVYMSYASRSFNDDDLAELLVTARKNNSRLGLTGMLLFNEDRVFIQAIEGPADNVHQVYNKIKSDPRHEKIQELISLPIVERSFPNWTMAFHRLERTSNYEGFSDFMETTKENKLVNHSDNFAIDMLNYFKTDHRA